MAAAQAPLPPPADKPPRLMSLDAFRGATVAGMILVNNPGSWQHMYAPLGHADWHGVTPTDWIFPFFLFIVGVAIPFSFAARRATTRSMILAISRRSIILIALGLMIGLIPYNMNNGFFNLAGQRYPGVLQRIGVCYFAVAMLALFLHRRGIIVALIAVLAIYSALMLGVAAPGFSRGDLSPEGNLAHYVDVAVFGRHVSSSYADPEGLLSTLPAIGTVICGWLVGTRLRRNDLSHGERIAGVFAAGVLGLIAGSILDAVLMPINKKLWTPSYTIYTAGLACLGLGVFYWLIDMQGWRKWAAPFVAMGMNAITIFVLAGVVARLMLIRAIPAPATDAATQPAAGVAIKTWLYRAIFEPHFDPVNASLAWALCFVAAFTALAMLMHKRRIYFKV